MKKVRLKDIAQLASVSETTVSLVLNKKKTRISKEKQEEIINIAKELNYQPNHIARSLVQKKSFTIGLIVPDITNPFFSSLARYVEDFLYQKNYLLLIGNSNNSTEREKLLIQSYISRQVDGILLCPSSENAKVQEGYNIYLEKLPVPLIVIDRILENTNLLQISYDDEAGGVLATQYLLDNHCQTVACVTGPLFSQSSIRRLAGYKKVLHANHILEVDKLIFEGDFSFESGVKLAPAILQASPDGIFFFNDLMAYGFFYYLRKQNISQKDYLVCGYDNLQLSEMFHIMLPSIEQNTQKLSQKCCQTILKSIEHSHIRKTELLKPTLIIPQ